MKKRCFVDKDNKSILDNQNIFTEYHKNSNTDNLTIDNNLKIIIPVTINICLTTSKYSIDFIKYSKYMYLRELPLKISSNTFQQFQKYQLIIWLILILVPIQRIFYSIGASRQYPRSCWNKEN